MQARRRSAAKSWFLLASRYLFTAGVSFVVYFLAIFVFFSVLHLSYLVAVALAYGITLAVHFSMNRAFTFNSTSSAFVQQVLRYGATALFNYFVQVLIIHVLYSRWHVNFYVSTLAGLIANLAVGFFLLRSWVFSAGDAPARPERTGS